MDGRCALAEERNGAVDQLRVNKGAVTGQADNDIQLVSERRVIAAIQDIQSMATVEADTELKGVVDELLVSQLGGAGEHELFDRLRTLNALHNVVEQGSPAELEQRSARQPAGSHANLHHCSRQAHR